MLWPCPPLCVPADDGEVLDTLQFMDTLSTNILHEGLVQSALMYRKVTVGRLVVYADWLVGLTVASMMALLLFFALGYRPAILQMDKDMRRTRSMLLVFPDEVGRGGGGGPVAVQCSTLRAGDGVGLACRTGGCVGSVCAAGD